MSKFLTGLIYAIVIICCLLILAARFSVSGIRLFSVQSGSMEPAMKTGSMIIVKSMSSYNVGDIISYYDREDSKKTITHRLTKTTTTNGITQLITKGDANNTADPIPVTSDMVIGKALYPIPFLGYLVNFARTTVGFMLLIVIPVTIIIYEEMRKIHHETKRIVKRRKEKKGIQESIKKEEDNKFFGELK